MKNKIIKGVFIALIFFVLTSACEAGNSNGKACTANGDCSSGKCINKVCCNAGQCGWDKCYNAGDTYTQSFHHYEESVAGVSYYTYIKYKCSAEGSWKKINGEKCGANNECASDNCITGVCCGKGQCSGGGACYDSNKTFVESTPHYEESVAGVSYYTYVNRVCTGGNVWKLANEQSCKTNDQCLSNSCKLGACCGINQCGFKNKCYTTGQEIYGATCLYGTWVSKPTPTASLQDENGTTKKNFVECCTKKPVFLKVCLDIQPPKPPSEPPMTYLESGDPDVYVVPQGTYSIGNKIPGDVTEKIETILIPSCKNPLLIKIWNNAVVGNYQVILDFNKNGKIDKYEIVDSLKFSVQTPDNCVCGTTTTTTTTTTSTTTTIPRLGHLKIFKFDDYNRNGVWEFGEPTLGGFRFIVTGPRNSSVVTSQWGEAFIWNLPFGTYIITEQVPTGWMATTPNPQTAVIDSEYLKEVQFGNVQVPASTTTTTICTTTTTTSTTTTTINHDCHNLWWYDNSHRECAYKEFCGEYMYYGLRTFGSKTECEETLEQPTTTTTLSPCQLKGINCEGPTTTTLKPTTTTIKATTTTLKTATTTLPATTTTFKATTTTLKTTTTTVKATTTTTTTAKTTATYPKPELEVKGQVKVTVYDDYGSPVKGAQIKISGPQSSTLTTDGDGEAYLFNLPAGTYTLTETATGDSKTITIKNPALITVDF